MNKKAITIGLILALAAVQAAAMALAAPLNGSKKACTTIQSAELYASDGSLLKVGYNQWGYNYQALLFNGFYCDANQ
ncbi:MAG: hypothetical protein PVF70_11010, partial [Anaerolineales bacterium]